MLLWLASVVVLSAAYRRLPRIVRLPLFFFVGFPVWMGISGAARALDSFSYGLVCWLSGVMLFGGAAFCALAGQHRPGSKMPRATPRRKTVPVAQPKKEPMQDAPTLGRRKFRFDD